MTDVNEILKQMRSTWNMAIGNMDQWPDEVRAFFEGFAALDEKLSGGGSLPDAWGPKPPAYNKNPKLDQLYFDTFLSALEGGIGDWALSESYHWTTNGHLSGEDREGFYSDIVDPYPNEEPYFTPVRIDRNVIARGYQRLIGGAEPMLHHQMRGKLTAAYWNPDHADIDADDADVIVQLGLFGKVVYG